MTDVFYRLCVAALIATSLFAFRSAIAEPLAPFHAKYTAFKWGDDIGQADMKLEKLGEFQYSLTYSSSVSKFFLSDKRFEHSIFSYENNEPMPREYHYKRSGTGPDKSLSVRFDYEKNQIIVDDKNTLALSGQLDNQIYRVLLPTKLKDGFKEGEFSFINYRGDEREYGVEVIGRQKITLPYGEIDTIKVQLVRDSNKRKTFIWFAPSLDFNLVRLQQFKDDEEQGDIQLSSFNPL